MRTHRRSVHWASPGHPAPGSSGSCHPCRKFQSWGYLCSSLSSKGSWRRKSRGKRKRNNKDAWEKVYEKHLKRITMKWLADMKTERLKGSRGDKTHFLLQGHLDLVPHFSLVILSVTNLVPFNVTDILYFNEAVSKRKQSKRLQLAYIHGIPCMGPTWRRAQQTQGTRLGHEADVGRGCGQSTCLQGGGWVATE